MSIHRYSPPSVLIQARAFTLGWRKTNVQQHSPKQEGKETGTESPTTSPQNFIWKDLNVMQCPQYTCGKRQTLVLVCLSLQGPGSLHQALSNTGLLLLFYFWALPRVFHKPPWVLTRNSIATAEPHFPPPPPRCCTCATSSAAWSQFPSSLRAAKS
eukprot:EG_transcript_38027